MSNIINHLTSANQIIKAAKTKIQLKSTSMNAEAAEGTTVPGSVARFGTQSELDDRFENFTVPEPNPDQDTTVMGFVTDAGASVLGTNITREEAELYQTLNDEEKERFHDIRTEAYRVSEERYPRSITQGGQ